MAIQPAALYRALLSDLSEYIDVTVQPEGLPGWSVDSSSRDVACYALRDSLLKKYQETDRPGPSACAAAQEKFLGVNESCKDRVIPYEFSSDEVLIGEVKRALHDFWFSGFEHAPLVSCVSQCFLAGRAGPGASIQARDTDFYTKFFDSALTGTRDLPYLWERCVSKIPTWSEADRLRAVRYGTSVVESSKYSFVSKTATVARGICTEPSINMWFQLGFGKHLEVALKYHFGVDLSTQPDVNRELADVGSRDDSLVTLDLESASDSIAISVLKEILPKSMLDWLLLFRSPSTILPSGEVLALNMVSTMGNGFTFPLMTAIFLAVAKASMHLEGITFKSRGVIRERNVGVFGDDIIVPSGAYSRVLRGLYLLGFKVNETKTFVKGRFRESCGGDFYEGVNVRGVYVKSLRTEQDLFVAINNLNRWTAKTGVKLPDTVSLLVSAIKNPQRKLTPFDENDDAGIHYPAYGLRHSSYRANTAALRLYNASVPRKWDFIIVGDVVWTYRSQVSRLLNPQGSLIAFLAGNIRGYRVTLRQKETRYTTKRKASPRWDYFPPRPLEGLPGPSGGKRFVDACERNFVSSVLACGG